MDSMPVVFATDFEGPLANPAIDIAWDIYRELVSQATRSRYPESAVRAFDEYDDARWRHERRDETNGHRHSTGTFPLLIDCIAALDGLTDRDITELAYQKMGPQQQGYNPGAQDLLGRTMRRGPVRIVTSSHPAMPLVAADHHSLSYDNIFTHGWQVDGSPIPQESHMGYRSPLRRLSGQEGLGRFLDKYLTKCSRVLQAIASGDPKAIWRATARHDSFLRGVSGELGNTLRYMFLYELGVMGGHRKAGVLRNVAPDGNVFYLGDGIVDADPIEFARYGCSINCTNDEALQASKLNLVTRDLMTIDPLVADIQAGVFELEGAPERYSGNGLKIFTADDIRDGLGDVKEENKTAKGNLKAHYAASMGLAV